MKITGRGSFCPAGMYTVPCNRTLSRSGILSPQIRSTSGRVLGAGLAEGDCATATRGKNSNAIKPRLQLRFMAFDGSFSFIAVYGRVIHIVLGVHHDHLLRFFV